MKQGCCESPSPAARTDDPRVSIVLRGSLADMQRAGNLLAAAHVDSIVVAEGDPGGGGCCGKTFHVAVASQDAPRAREVLEADWKRGLSAEQLAAMQALATLEVDPDSTDVTCPACLTVFPPGPAACPDCGLAVL